MIRDTSITKEGRIIFETDKTGLTKLLL